jgi:hypothetical protein
MQQGRRWFLAAPLALATIAFGQPDPACPAFPGDDLGHGGDTVTAVLTTGPLVSADGGITLDDPDADRLIPMLSSSAVLRLTVTPDGGAEAARDVVFPTAGFEEALTWLGCGAADACPVRSCDR